MHVVPLKYNAKVFDIIADFESSTVKFIVDCQ